MKIEPKFIVGTFLMNRKNDKAAESNEDKGTLTLIFSYFQKLEKKDIYFFQF